MPDDLARNKIVSPKRDAIVVAATELFLEHGFGDVSMDTIAAKAEVSKRTVYSHFENKAQLFEGVMGDACAGRHLEHAARRVRNKQQHPERREADAEIRLEQRK